MLGNTTRETSTRKRYVKHMKKQVFNNIMK